MPILLKLYLRVLFEAHMKHQLLFPCEINYLIHIYVKIKYIYI